MDEQKMELRKLRDFSQNISDTFQFIKQEIKPLLVCYFAICGVVMLASGIIGGMYERDTTGNIFTTIFSGQTFKNDVGSVFSGLYFLWLFMKLLIWVLIHAVLGAYVKVYLAKGNVSPTIEEVWKNCLPYILPLCLYIIVFGIITGVGMVFCLAPGIYFGVVFAPFAMIYIIEDASLGQIFNRCFYLIKDNFWASLGIYIIVYIIYIVSSMLIGTAIGAIAGITSYFTTKNIGNTVGIVTGVLEVFQHVFYIIFFVSVALNYFNLTEQADGDGLLKRIENLGNNNNNNQIEEQY